MKPVVALASWWHCACLTCISDLRRLEKNLNFLSCIHVLDLVLKLDQPSDGVPLHVENPVSDKVDVILPSNEVIDWPASNEVDENALSIIVAAKQSLNQFYENIPSNIVADNQSRNDFDRNILSNVAIGNQAENVVEKLPSNEVNEKQSINEGAVERNTDLEDSLQVELSNFLDLGSC